MDIKFPRVNSVDKVIKTYAKDNRQKGKQSKKENTPKNQKSYFKEKLYDEEGNEKKLDDLF